MKVKVAKLVLLGLMSTASVVLLAMTGLSVLTSTSDVGPADEKTLEQQVAHQLKKFETLIHPDVFVEVEESGKQAPSVAVLFVLPASVCGPPLVEIDAYARLLQERHEGGTGVHLQAAIIAEDKSQAERYIRLADLRMPALPFGKMQDKIEVDGSYVMFIDMSSYMSTHRLPLYNGVITRAEYKNAVLDIVFSHHMSGPSS